MLKFHAAGGSGLMLLLEQSNDRFDHEQRNQGDYDLHHDGDQPRQLHAAAYPLFEKVLERHHRAFGLHAHQFRLPPDFNGRHTALFASKRKLRHGSSRGDQ